MEVGSGTDSICYRAPVLRFERRAWSPQRRTPDGSARAGNVSDPQTVAEQQMWERTGGSCYPARINAAQRDVQIIVEPTTDKRRANTKSAAVVLRTAPNGPKFVALDPQASIAADNSSRTDASVSTDTRDHRADLASAEPTLPSAQAACARTNGSASDNALASAGTASGDPQLPSPTQALRANPARPARRIAEPLENESHAASSSAVSSSAMSDGEAVPGCDLDAPGSSCTPNGGSPGARAANEGSDHARENLRVYGQHS